MKSFIKNISKIGYIVSLELPPIMILVFGYELRSLNFSLLYFIADFLPGLLIEEDDVFLKNKSSKICTTHFLI